jgi:hypothetical protein
LVNHNTLHYEYVGSSQEFPEFPEKLGEGDLRRR